MVGGKIATLYFKHYKKLLFLPLLLLLLSIFTIYMKFQSTGDIINRDITLKGGVSITVLDNTPLDAHELEAALGDIFLPNDLSVRILRSAGSQIGFLIESDISELDQDTLDSVLQIISEKIGKELERESYSIETIGSSLGNSFFLQIIRALILAFVFMGIVVFLYFRTFIPSMAVILAALSDIVVTVAVINLLGITIGTAGIAALLMLIGYSIDTDIMLTSRVLKRKELVLHDRIKGAFITGITMTLTTIGAVTVALFFSEAEVIRQIMTILLIGLIIDLVYTWIQNSGLLIWYVERK